MIQKRGRHHLPPALAQLQEFPICLLGADGFADVEPGQGPHPVTASIGAEGGDVREFEVAPGLHGFGDEGGVVVFAQTIGDEGSIAGHDAQPACCAATTRGAVMLPVAVRAHQTHE